MRQSAPALRRPCLASDQKKRAPGRSQQPAGQDLRRGHQTVAGVVRKKAVGAAFLFAVAAIVDGLGIPIPVGPASQP